MVGAREDQQPESDEQKDAPSGRQLQQQSPEKLPSDVKRPAPAGELLNFFPVDVATIKAVTGAGIGCELRPEVVDLAALADALPEMAQASHPMEPRGGRRDTGSWRRAHGS